jgi:hypothetical protein
MNAHDAPEEEHALIEFRQRNLPGFATVNVALKDFEPKAIFSWHLSVLIMYEDKAENVGRRARPALFVRGQTGFAVQAERRCSVPGACHA